MTILKNGTLEKSLNEDKLKIAMIFSEVDDQLKKNKLQGIKKEIKKSEKDIKNVMVNKKNLTMER